MGESCTTFAIPFCRSHQERNQGGMGQPQTETVSGKLRINLDDVNGKIEVSEQGEELTFGTLLSKEKI